MYVALNREMFAGKSIIEIADIRNGGMSIYGGVLGGILIEAIYCKIRKSPLHRWQILPVWDF